MDTDLIKRLDKLFNGYEEVSKKRDLTQIVTEIEELKQEILQLKNEIKNIKELHKSKSVKSKKLKFINLLRDKYKNKKHIIKIGETLYFIDSNGLLRYHKNGNKLSFYEAREIFSFLYKNQKTIQEYIRLL